jgi:uncharacterized protein (UPF0276 family)
MTRSVLEMIQLRIEEYQEKLDHPIHVEGSPVYSTVSVSPRR